MGGISSSVGVFSGIDTGRLIEQLLALEARPRIAAQSRMAQIQLQQAAYLDLNSRMGALRTASTSFRDKKVFQTKAATSSDANVLAATADTNAAVGNYTFIVDRLVSTQQLLSRGFANRDASGIGATAFTFEPAQARLDRNVDLAELNNAQGVARGRMIITDSGGRAATVDLSRATTVSDVLEAINTNGTAQVTASVEGGRFVITDTAGGSFTVTDAQGSTTATSLGLAGISATAGRITGNQVYGLSASTSLASLNDGNGVSTKPSTTEDSYSFIINVGGVSPKTVRVNIGDVYQTIEGTLTKVKGAVADVGGVITRINEALTAAGVSGIQASIDSTNGRIQILDSTGDQPLTITEGTDTTATDLGLNVDPQSGDILGRRILSGMQGTLLRGLQGGTATRNDGALNFQLRSGAQFSLSLNPDATVQDALRAIEDASISGGVKRVRATLDSRGTGIVITDLSGGTGNLIITGTEDSDAAAALGISTGPAGKAGAEVSSGNLQRQYIGRATQLSSLNNGKGVGTGVMRITDSTGATSSLTISDSIRTIGDMIDFINSRGLRISAQINANGDGIEIREALGPGDTAGSVRIKVEDTSGSVAKNLSILGTAAGTEGQNVIDGSFERTVNLSAADNLQQVADKINAAKTGITASIVRDGSGAAPFRLSLTSGSSGTAGRFVIDSGNIDLGLTTIDAGRDARVFYGSTDASTGIAVTSSTNTIDNVLQGVKIDLKSVSATPVSLSVVSDTGTIETAVNVFVTTFNTVLERISLQTSYDKDSNRKGPLLGDSTTIEMRNSLFNVVQGRALGATGTYSRLSDIGVSIGAGGRISLDSGKLRQALADDPESVESLFIARVQNEDTTITVTDGITARNPNSGNSFSSLGVMGQIEQLAKRYVDGNESILGARDQQLRQQVTQQQARIGAIDSRIASRRLILERQFQAMERAIGQMQNQQSALASMPRAR
jgi:flagellar hook-associated protein 2